MQFNKTHNRIRHTQHIRNTLWPTLEAQTQGGEKTRRLLHIGVWVDQGCGIGWQQTAQQQQGGWRCCKSRATHPPGSEVVMGPTHHARRLNTHTTTEPNSRSLLHPAVQPHLLDRAVDQGCPTVHEANTGHAAAARPCSAIAAASWRTAAAAAWPVQLDLLDGHRPEALESGGGGRHYINPAANAGISCVCGLSGQQNNGTRRATSAAVHICMNAGCVDQSTSCTCLAETRC